MKIYAIQYEGDTEFALGENMDVALTLWRRWKIAEAKELSGGEIDEDEISPVQVSEVCSESEIIREDSQ